MQRPLAIAVIGGLLANMLFTRMVIPVGYLVLAGRGRSTAAPSQAAPPAPVALPAAAAPPAAVTLPAAVALPAAVDGGDPPKGNV